MAEGLAGDLQWDSNSQPLNTFMSRGAGSTTEPSPTPYPIHSTRKYLYIAKAYNSTMWPNSTVNQSCQCDCVNTISEIFIPDSMQWDVVRDRSQENQYHCWNHHSCTWHMQSWPPARTVTELYSQSISLNLSRQFLLSYPHARRCPKHRCYVSAKASKKLPKRTKCELMPA